MQVPFHLYIFPWKRSVALAKDGKAGLIGILKNTDREAYLDFSAPFFTEELTIYVTEGNAFPYSKVSDLYGKNIGITLGWTYGEAFEQAKKLGKITVTESETDINNFYMLSKGRVDAVISDKISATMFIKKTKGNKVVSLKTPLSSEKIYIAYPKVLRQQALLQKFNTEIEKMRKDGTINATVIHYTN